MEALRSAGKAWLELVVRPLVGWLEEHRVTPNELTLVGLAVTLASLPFIAAGWLTTGGLLFGIGSLADALDGALARHGSRVTRFGAFLDSTLDRVGEGAALAALAVHLALQGEVFAIGALAVAMLGGNLTSYIRARAESLGIVCDVGWAARTERCAIMTVGLLFHLAVPMVYALAVVTVITVVQRMLHVQRELTRM